MPTTPAPWAKRPIEEARLFNPAFCSLLLGKAVADYLKQVGDGLPYPLAFIVIPAVLHAQTRNALPSRTTALLQNWVADHTDLLTAFPDHARQAAPIVREATLFALMHRKLTIERGRLLPGPRRYRSNATVDSRTDETIDCVRSAAFLGRWFAVSGTTATILASWGAKP